MRTGKDDWLALGLSFLLFLLFLDLRFFFFAGAFMLGSAWPNSCCRVQFLVSFLVFFFFLYLIRIRLCVLRISLEISIADFRLLGTAPLNSRGRGNGLELTRRKNIRRTDRARVPEIGGRAITVVV